MSLKNSQKHALDWNAFYATPVPHPIIEPQGCQGICVCPRIWGGEKTNGFGFLGFCIWRDSFPVQNELRDPDLDPTL